MTFWHLQMHPNDPSFDKEIEIIEQKGVIGLGEWSDGKNVIHQFIHQMQIGDIVLVRHGKQSLALVEITGEATFREKNDIHLDWFEHRRTVKPLLLFKEEYEAFPGAGTGTLNKLVRSTTKTYRYIEQLYQRFSTKSANPLNHEYLLQDSYLNGHAGFITAIVTTEQYIISASNDETIRLWDKVTKKEVATLQGHKNYIVALVIVDENTLASADEVRIKLWDLTTHECIATLEGDYFITSLILVNSNILASGSYSPFIQLWDLTTYQCIVTLKGHSDGIRSLALVDVNTLASASDDKTIKLWDLSTQNCIVTLEGNASNVTSLVLMDKNTLVSGSLEKIKFWDLVTYDCTMTLNGNISSPTALAVVDINTLAISSGDTIKLWDITQQSYIALQGHSNSVTSLALMGKNTLVSGSYDKKIKFWDLTTYKCIATIKGNNKIISSFTFVDKNTLAIVLDHTSIKLWDITSRIYSATLEGHTKSISSLVLVDKNTLASSSYDNTIKLWNLTSHKCNVTLEGHTNVVSSLALVDKNTLASSSYDNTIKLWDITTGKCITLEGHTSSVTSLVLVDTNTLVSSSHDKTIKFWDISTHECIATIESQNSFLVSLTLIDSNTLASSSPSDQTIKLWDIRDKNNIEALGEIKRKNRNISYHDNLLWVDDGNGTISALDISDKTTPKNREVYNVSSTVSALLYMNNLLVFATQAGDFYVEKIEQNRFQSTKPNVENRFYIKTLLLGDSGVGKTSLGHWCEYKTHDDMIHSTHGMRFFESDLNDRIPITIQGKEEKHLFSFNLWDFGGQPEYQIAHKQNFDKTRLIFLVVDLSRTDHDDNSILFWVNSIKEHYDKMNKDQLGIFVIGTKGSDKQKLKTITEQIEGMSKISYVKHFLCDVTQEKFEDSELYTEMQTYITNQFKLKHDALLDSDGLLVVQEVKKLRKQKFYLENAEELKRSLKENDSRENNSVDDALGVMADDGMIEKLDHYIVLRPYWKNIFATAILRHAEENPKVHASISKQALFEYAFKVEFDKLLDSEKKSLKEYKNSFRSDADIHKETFGNRSHNNLKKLFMKELVRIFLEDKICYFKNGMFVFPSRFHYKKWQVDSKKYFKVGSVDLVSTKNVEVTISTVVCSLNYCGEYQIVKHLNKGVKLKDAHNNEYLVEFSREDIIADKKNQASTSIIVYAKNNVEESNQHLLANIKSILKHSLESMYEYQTFDLYKKDNIHIGSVSLTTKGTITSEDIIQTTEEYVLTKRSSSNGATDIRFIQKIQEEIEKTIKGFDEKIEKFFESKNNKTKLNILHLSDLHFDEKCIIENEITYLIEDAKRLNSFENEKSLQEFDYIILSGDLSASGSANEFSKVAQFVSRLIDLCDIDAERVLIVPGNHDYSREITHGAYQIRNFDALKFREKKDFKINDRIYLERDDEKWKNKFKYFSERLYETIYHEPFNTDSTKQIKVMQDDKLAFVLMNTSTHIDHFTPLQVSFEVDSFINVQKQIDKGKSKIVIGHHPLSFEHNYDFINNLHQFDYKAYIHGHVHRNNLISFQDVIASTQRVLQIGSGIFYATNPKSMIPGVPLRYNVIIIDIETKNISVETREREKHTIHWRPACLYPQEDGSMSCMYENKQ
ncbi:MAG: metallophosphoesterase [Sulfuricurvum sp.]|uniref:metallophosphoesterase n=1 Tax=Sulfuricurvum sp. TaxID=2025608 RepID=UPI002609A212|nr:metallophosphoesterase [Sulfuricurvum sp.]MDD2829348.1 metallophosphoesterase [Sulfuricurvum sp.]MDD4949160.1 metallophosphoesterase [Sulfuricurvum sp.]